MSFDCLKSQGHCVLLFLDHHQQWVIWWTVFGHLPVGLLTRTAVLWSSKRHLRYNDPCGAQCNHICVDKKCPRTQRCSVCRRYCLGMMVSHLPGLSRSVRTGLDVVAPSTDTPHPPVTVANQHSDTVQGSKKAYIPRHNPVRVGPTATGRVDELISMCAAHAAYRRQ